MLAIRLLGPVDIRDPAGQVVEGLLRQPKRVALLAYLAVAEPRGFHRRDTLLGLFWPESPTKQARLALSQSLHFLRHHLGDDAILTRGEGEVALNDAVVSCDVGAFREAIALGDHAQAVSHYGGPLLAGFSTRASAGWEHWLDGARDRLGRAYVTALEQLALEADAAGDAPRAVALWRQLAELDPYATRVTVRLIAALEVAGNRAGALQVADQHGRRLQEELGAEPSPEVEALARRLRAQPVPTQPQTALSTHERLAHALAGRYRIDRLLGGGGMALVYLADDLKLGRPVAIKVLRPELAAAIGSERFLNEIDIAARLAHPNILPLHDFGQADGLVYYVMPYVEGPSLRDRLAREGPLALKETLRIVREVADALAHAHDKGIVHRDIKPANILFLADHAVVSDFGVARAIGEAAEDRALLATTGTPAYMSPEQAAGSPDLDARSDLYSLGCVLHEMLVGVPPDSSGAPAGSVRPATPVPTPLDAALGKALAKNPADRFATTAEFADALSAEGVPVAAPSASAKRRLPRRRTLLGVGAVVVVAAAVLLGRRSGDAAFPRTAIAVLPFENLSTEGPHSLFAPGLHDELLTQLAKVAALTVIGRASVMAYAGVDRPLPEIAAELGVGTIVEASVQVVEDRLRVNVQLLDAQTGVQLWADRYDRTLDDAFAVQSDIALHVVEAVGATLGSSDQRAFAEAPTGNPEAYRFYLQGREYHTRPGYLRQNQEIAQQLYEQALALDPGFALAHAALSRVHSMMYWLRYDPSPVRAARAHDEAEAALRLAPESPEAHIAMGVAHYSGRREYRRALQEFRIALDGLPNDAELWMRIGWVHRRLGNWDEVLRAFDTATRLDPRNADLFASLGGDTYQNMHRYAEAVRAYDQALSLAPDNHVAAVRKGQTYVLWQGQLDTLRAVLSRLPLDAEMADFGTTTAQQLSLLLWERQADSILQLLATGRVGVFEGGQDFFLPASLYAARAHQMRGDRSAAQAACDSARLLLDSVVAELPDDWRVHAARGLALAGLGRRDEALREARWLQQSMVYREDARHGGLAAENRAQILAQAGEADTALDEIERLLTMPSWLSVHTLRLEPLWDPLREHPRFQRLLEQYGN